MIADIKKLNSIVTELLIRGRKLNISLVFITQSYFKVPKDVRSNTTHFLITKISLNHSSDIDPKKLKNIYREYKKEPYSFLVIDSTRLSDDSLRFTKKFFGMSNI